LVEYVSELRNRGAKAGAIALLLPIAAGAVIVDRIAIVAADKIITDSEIVLRVRLTAFQENETLDLSLEKRRRAAQQLIDQRLVEHEMDVGRFPRLDADHRKALLEDYEKEHYKSDATAATAALARYGLTPENLAEELGKQADLLTFLTLRFRPAVQVTDQDVQKYIDSALKAAGKEKQAEDPEALSSEVRAEVEKKLTYERADKELDLWLQDQRKRTKIEYLEKELAPPEGNRVAEADKK
jgi:antitoxin component HigA of HigAB toxin-antitoxin module